MQDTVEFTTPVRAHNVVIRGWVTGRDELAIQNAINEKLKINYEIGGGGSGVTDATVFTAGQRKALELLLVSVDGKTDGLVDLVLDMHKDDYHFVKEQIDKVTNGLDEEKKSDSPDKPSPAVGVAPAG